MTEPTPEKQGKGPRRDVASIADLVAALRPQSEFDDPDVEGEEGDAGEHDAGPDGGDARGDAAPAEPAAVQARQDGIELSDTLPIAADDDLSKVRGTASPRLVSIVESLLFAAERPLGVGDLRRILKDPTVRQVQLALKALRKQTEGRGVVLGQVAGGFRLRTNPDNARYVQRMLAGRPTRLSRMQLETLAIVAYRQPITKPEIDHVRGVDCGAVLKLLLDRDLARIVGRKEEAGRPHLYGTTIEFLEFFNLMSLRDMPDLHEFRELSEDSRAELRDQYGDAADEVEAEVLGQERLFDATADGLPTASDPDAEVNAEADAESEPWAEPEPEEQWQSSSGIEPEGETALHEARAESTLEAKPEAKVEAKAEVEAEVETETVAEPEAQPEGQPEPEPEPDAAALDPDAPLGTDDAPDPDREP